MRRRLATALAATLWAAAVGCGAVGDGRGDTAAPASAAAARAAAPPELPVPRTEVAGVTWRGRLVVAGGMTADGGASALVHTLVPPATRWRAAPALPVPLHHAGMAVLGRRVYVAGGYTNGPGQPWVAQAAVYSLGPGEARWRDEPPLPGGPRGALGLAAAGRWLVAVGGEAGGRPLARTELFDRTTRAWTAGPDLSRPREHLAAATLDGWVYALGGRTAAEGNLATVESLDPGRDRAWRAERPLAHARGGFGAAMVGDRLCAAGGEEAGGTIASVECLEPAGWVATARMQRPRHGLAVMALRGRLHAVAGGEQPGLSVSGAHEVLDT